MHRLLLPPARRILPPIRMPQVQAPGPRMARETMDTLTDRASTFRSSLRLIRTTASNRKVSGPLSSPQRFTRPDGGPNTPDQMAAGGHKMNARRLVPKTRGQSAGI